jgi:hypothetical protein
MSDDPKKREPEDANQAAFRIVQQATRQAEGPDTEDWRCTHVWISKRCKLRAGHLETHQFDV